MPDAKIKISSEFDNKGVNDAKAGLAGLGAGAEAAKSPLAGFGGVAAGVFTGLMSWTAVIAIITQVWGAVKEFAIGSLKSWGEAEAASAKLSQAMRNQGAYTRDALKDLEDYANQLQATTTFEDDAIVGVMSSLTAFGLQGDTLKATTKATLDLAQATGMDLDSAGKVVAKSIGSSTNALARYGITIDTSASKTEKAAQVVQAISDLYGGQAAAATTTYEGKMAQLGNTFDDLKESVGKELAPIFADFAGKMVDFALVAVKVFNSIVDGVKSFIAFRKALEENNAVFGAFSKAVQFFVDTAGKTLLVIIEGIGKGWSFIKGKMDDYTKAHTKATDKIIEEQEAQQKKHKETTEFTAEQLAKQAEAHEKALAEKSAESKKYWVNQLALAGKDLKDQKALLERSLSDTRLQHKERVELEQKLKETIVKIKEDEVAAKKKADEELKKSAKETADDVAKAFMEGADNARFSWETTTQKIATKVISDGLQPMVEETKKSFGGFGDIGNLLLVGVGGAVGSIIGGFLGWGQQQTKSVAEYTKESYDKMVEKTNDKLDEIGRKKSEVSKAIDIAKELSAGFTEGQTFADTTQSQRIAAITGINIAGMTRGQALTALGGKLATSTGSAYRVQADEMALYETPAAQSVLEKLRKAAAGEPIGASSFIGMSTEEQDFMRNVLKLDPRDTRSWLGVQRGGQVYLGSAGMGAYNAALQRYAELKGIVGGAELDTIRELMRIEKETGATIPSYAVGGVVPSTGLALVHAGETITPAGRASGGNVFNFTINGVNFSSEEEKKALAKQLSAYIMKYVDGDVRLPYGKERRL